MDTPLLSIVIANYNYGRFLEEAIQSVIAQDVRDKVELIICDAASTDNSVEIIRKYTGGLPPNTLRSEWEADNSQLTTHNSKLISWWCSEKDGGQSAAFNKGFSHARGEWLTWLNADDLLLPGTLRAFAQLVARKPGAEWVTGNKMSFDSATGKIVQVNWGPHRQPPFLRRKRAFNAVFGPTTFFKKSLYMRTGPIDERLHYAMDTEYWARLTIAGVHQTRLNRICWAFRVHEDSKTEGTQSRGIIERRLQETEYWQGKTGYVFRKGMKNPWYVAWCLWRIADGSWIMRWWNKARWQGAILPIQGMRT